MQINQAHKWGKRLLPSVLILRIMKLTAVFLLAVCVHTGATGFSQNVTLSVRNASLEKVFKEIRRQTGYSFFYKTELLRNAPRVSLSVHNADLKETLDLCFSNLPVQYSIIAQTVVISPRVQENTPVLPEKKEERVRVQGTVTNSSGEPLAGASVRLKGSSTGTTTDVNGNFSLNIPGDRGILIISFVGFITQEVEAGEGADIRVMLSPLDNKVDEVVVIGYGSVKKSDLTGSVSSVNSEQITQVKASFSTSMLSMSEGLSCALKKSKGIPSTTYKGSLAAWMELVPRILMATPSPG